MDKYFILFYITTSHFLCFFFYFLVCASAEYTGNYKFVMICGDSNDSSWPSVTDFLTSNKRIQLTTSTRLGLKVEMQGYIY